MKYRLVDGKPLIYSVGADRVDAGGTPPKAPRNGYAKSAAEWGVKPADAVRGDWILYPVSDE